MGAAPADKLGIVSGMLALTRTLGQSTGIAVLGAIWAGLTLSYTKVGQVTSATDAPALAQVSALQNTFIFMAIMTFVALLLASWALVKERRLKINPLALNTEPIAEKMS